jgi:non-canonical poly(A) RNA polymerase PAPD5/7
VRDTTPEFLGGGADSEMLQATKFRNIDDLTDSDEAEMDVSSSPEDGDAEPPRKKQATAANMLPEKPKWSNPDPYTVLPPIDETQVKRRDFVKMIRKARVVSAAVQGEESKETKPNAVVSNEDFISFGDLDLNNKPPENAPRGPKASHGQDGDPALGSRKRTRDDEIIVLTGKQGFRFRHDGSILDIWHPKSGQNSTPWLDQSTPPTIHLGSM